LFLLRKERTRERERERETLWEKRRKTDDDKENIVGK